MLLLLSGLLHNRKDLNTFLPMSVINVGKKKTEHHDMKVRLEIKIFQTVVVAFNCYKGCQSSSCGEVGIQLVWRSFSQVEQFE